MLHSAPTTVEAVVIESLPHNLVLSDIDEVDRSGLAISRRHNFFIESRSEMANVFTVAINLVVVWFEINDRCLDLHGAESTPESTLQDGTPSFQSIGTISQSMYFTPDKQPDESDTSGSPNNSSGAGSSTVDV